MMDAYAAQWAAFYASQGQYPPQMPGYPPQVPGYPAAPGGYGAAAQYPPIAGQGQEYGGGAAGSYYPDGQGPGQGMPPAQGGQGAGQQAPGGAGGDDASRGGVSTSLITVPNDFVGRIIGKQGASIKEIQEQSGAKVDIPQDTRSPMREISITGTPSQISVCTTLIHAKMASRF
jgi:hypothetical protein